MRSNIIAISSRLKKQAQQVKLEKEIKRLETEHQHSNDKVTLGLLKETGQKQDDLSTYKTEGSLRFINREYYEMTNRASHMLAFQLRKVQSNRKIHKIKGPDNNKMLAKPNNITEAYATHLKLYEAKENPYKIELFVF